MENASRALVMAAGVLLGVMIITVSVALFNSFSGLSGNIAKRVDETKITEWNNNYLKYYGKISVEENGKTKVKPIEVTAHEIVSLANHAYENNKKLEIEDKDTYSENSHYVQIQVGNISNFEKLDNKAKNEFLQNNSLTASNETKYYKCDSYKISKITKKVIYIKFVEY